MSVPSVPSPLSSSSALYFLPPPPFHRRSSSQTWSCPGRDEWPGVTSSICPGGWIYRPRFSPKGHAIKCKQSSAHHYLLDGDGVAWPPGNSFEMLLNVNRVHLECNNFMMVIMDFQVAPGMTFTSKHKWSHSREHHLVEAQNWTYRVSSGCFC